MYFNIQREDLRRVMDMLSIGEQHARTLLIYHRWDVENLFAVYVDKGKASLFVEAGLSVDDHHDSDSTVSASVMCDICMDDVPSNESTRMECGHCFCNSCESLFILLFSALVLSKFLLEKLCLDPLVGPT